jgi:hypothetical protein
MAGEDSVHDLALHAYAAPVDDAYLSESLPERLKQIFLDHALDFLRPECVEVDPVLDWDLDRFVIH